MPQMKASLRLWLKQNQLMYKIKSKFDWNKTFKSTSLLYLIVNIISH